jgi:hypothetical protein
MPLLSLSLANTGITDTGFEYLIKKFEEFDRRSGLNKMLYNVNQKDYAPDSVSDFNLRI